MKSALKIFFQNHLEISDGDAIDIYVKQFASFLEDRSAVYISAPITTGQNYIEWYRKVGFNLKHDQKLYNEKHYKDVIESNLKIIRKFAHLYRIQTHDVVIEPASFENPGWSQHDYLYYWGSIICKYIKKIIVMDGWEYSRGCVFEYFVGKSVGIVFETQDQGKMSSEYAANLINLAICKLKDLPFDLRMHEIIYSEIINLK
jgi:hypothetical protein